jgi:hypothetical protein
MWVSGKYQKGAHSANLRSSSISYCGKNMSYSKQYGILQQNLSSVNMEIHISFPYKENKNDGSMQVHVP